MLMLQLELGEFNHPDNNQGIVLGNLTAAAAIRGLVRSRVRQRCQYNMIDRTGSSYLGVQPNCGIEPQTVQAWVPFLDVVAARKRGAIFRIQVNLALFQCI